MFYQYDSRRHYLVLSCCPVHSYDNPSCVGMILLLVGNHALCGTRLVERTPCTLLHPACIQSKNARSGTSQRLGIGSWYLNTTNILSFTIPCCHHDGKSSMTKWQFSWYNQVILSYSPEPSSLSIEQSAYHRNLSLSWSTLLFLTRCWIVFRKGWMDGVSWILLHNKVAIG